MTRAGDFDRPVPMGDRNPELIAHFAQVGILGSKQLDRQLRIAQG